MGNYSTRDNWYWLLIQRERRPVLQWYHHSNEGGHPGYLKTYRRICWNFWWKGMKRDIKQHIAACDVCQRNKSESVAPPGLLQTLPIPEKKWTNIFMDFIDGPPPSKGKAVIFVEVDRLSKYAHFITLSHPYSVAQVARAFMENVFKLHRMHCNRDLVVTSWFWKELIWLHGIKVLISPAYHPQTADQT